MTGTTLVVECATPEETEALGERIGALLEIGHLLDLRGDLGAGKTCLSRGIARGLGIPDRVRSPTFTICHVHRGPRTLFHLDAYRLEEPEELLIQGWDEMRTRGVVVIEWGERVPTLLPDDRVEILLAHVSAEDASVGSNGGAAPRRITIRGTGPRGEALVARL